ncbi:hypothetical protein ACTXT7_003966 [Hymenolepis weldensis]
MAMHEVSDRPQLKLDHVLSVPVDLREIKAAQIPNPSIHRTEELMNLHTTELDESNSRISASVEESKGESDEANTSELAQDTSHNLNKAILSFFDPLGGVFSLHYKSLIINAVAFSKGPLKEIH